MRVASGPDRLVGWIVAGVAFSVGLLTAMPGAAQNSSDARAESPPTIAARTAGMETVDGFFPIYWEVQYVVIGGLIDLAGNSQAMPQARGAATLALDERRRTLSGDALMLSREIGRFLDRPAAPSSPGPAPEAPPGAPIGDLPLPWLRLLEPACAW